MIKPEDFPVLDAFAIEQAAEARWMAEMARLKAQYDDLDAARNEKLVAMRGLIQPLSKELVTAIGPVNLTNTINPTDFDYTDPVVIKAATDVVMDGMAFRRILEAIEKDEAVKGQWERLVMMLGLTE